MTLLDSDRDGVLTPYEAAEAALALVLAADADGDGGAAAGEVEAWLIQRVTEASDEATELVLDLDRDGDGALSPSEIPKDLKPFLAGVDRDGDGVVTPAEIVEAAPFDSARPMIEAEFFGLLEELDEDGDGWFSLDALADELDHETLEEIAAFDLDGDGHVTRAELIQRIEAELRGAEFEIDGRIARMSGVIGASTPGRVLELIVESPEVELIELVDVPGSMDDDANLRAARLLHGAGLRTRVAAAGEIASGGVDFFLAGHDREIGKGARIGVHSWADGSGETGEIFRAATLGTRCSSTSTETWEWTSNSIGSRWRQPQRKAFTG